MSKCRRKTRRVTVAESLFLKKLPQQTLDVVPTNAACWLKASNRSTRRWVFHHATYKDVGMALNLIRLIVSAQPCIFYLRKKEPYEHVTIAADRADATVRFTEVWVHIDVNIVTKCYESCQGHSQIDPIQVV